MWKVTFESPYGDQPSVYWVTADSATEAEFVARQQIRSSVKATAAATVQNVDDVNSAGELWPRPRLVDGIRVHTFPDSRTAYDHTQVRADIHDGDVLHIPSESIAGFLMQAWPIAISPNHGELHVLTDPTNLVIDGVDYTVSARVAGTLLPHDGIEQPQARPDTMPHRGLEPADGVWTVTISGSERHDGEGAYIWVVNAPDANTAAAKAERHHRISEEDPDTVIRSVEPGAPGADYGWAYNDLRGIPAKTIVLTPQHIRHLASIRLTYKRRDAHYQRIADALEPGQPYPPAEVQLLDDLTADIADNFADLMNNLGYPI